MAKLKKIHQHFSRPEVVLQLEAEDEAIISPLRYVEEKEGKRTEEKRRRERKEERGQGMEAASFKETG